MICAHQLELDVRRWWNNNHGRKHGPLDAAWTGRSARDLLAWSCLAYHVGARMQHAGVEVEYVEERRGLQRVPAAVVVHYDDDHRVFDVKLVDDRLLRVQDDAGHSVASVTLDRQDHQYLRRVAHVIADAVQQIGNR
jgi:hypothetical protein